MEDILDDLLKLSDETEIVEFKKAERQFDKDKLGRYFSALSNEANLKGKARAWLVMGVNKFHKIVGTLISMKQINEYKIEVSRHTAPKITFSEVHIVYKEGKNVLMFEIPAAPKGQPVYWKGHTYGRDGESLGGLNQIEYDRIRAQIIAEDWSSKILPNADFSDLSEDAINFAREQYIEKNPKLKEEIDDWPDKVFLDKAKVTIKGQITTTAILLLGKPESNYLLSPATSRITWILRDKDNIEKDYEHFDSPLLLAVEKVAAKIRNLKYRYLNPGRIFPEETDQYDPYTIREALHNCIAHQDYMRGGKIIVIEKEDGQLIFTNEGNFIPGSVEEVVISDSPEPKYRNGFLVQAMVNLNMIDTIGSGIKRMFTIQRKKYFPLPEYDLSKNKVKVIITGKVVDVNYAKKLAEVPDLSLSEIILLDKVAKNKQLSKKEIRRLKTKELIEGRKPNFHISSDIAEVTGEKVDYMKRRGIDDDYCRKMIIEYLEKFERAKRSDFEDLLLDKLPDVLSEEQKKNKVKNNLQYLRRSGRITTENRNWRLVK